MPQFWGACVVLIMLFVRLGNASSARFTIPAANFDRVLAGAVFNISWDGAKPPSEISLERGSSQLIDYTIVVNAPNTTGSYLWTIPTNIPSDTYSLLIFDNDTYQGTTQYSQLFTITDNNSSASPFTLPTPVDLGAASTSMATTTPAPTMSTSSPGKTYMWGISAGTKIGIIVTTALVGIALLCLGLWYGIRLGRRRALRDAVDKEKSTIDAASTDIVHLKPELDGGEALVKVNEIDGAERIELESPRQVSEIGSPGVGSRIEMESPGGHGMEEGIVGGVGRGGGGSVNVGPVTPISELE